MVIAKLHIGLCHENGSFGDETCNIDYDITNFDQYGYNPSQMTEDEVWEMFSNLYWVEEEIEEMFVNHPEYNKEFGISISVDKIVVDHFMLWYRNGVKLLEAAE